jgi:hypothetical protein
MQLLRGISRGLGELWRIKEWKPCAVGSATEVIRIEALRFTQTQIEAETRGVYFDTRAVTGDPCLLHPLVAWRGPPGLPGLPYELGWLHFDQALNNTSSDGAFDQTAFYSGAGAKASVYVYVRSVVDGEGSRDAELERASAALPAPGLEDPWPMIEIGPFALKFFLSGSDMTVVGVAVSGMYFVKVRLTCFDDPKMRELMMATLVALCTCVEHAMISEH